MEYKYLQVINKNIFTRFINFIKGIFSRKADNKNSAEEESIENKDVKFDFVNNIKIYKEENNEILDLQSKYENKEIDLAEMSDEEIHELNLLYKKQVEELKKKIEDETTQISMLKYKIKKYSTNI